MSVKIVSTNYHPRPHQSIIHKMLKRFNVLLCHRRFGKTHLAINEILDQALRCPAKSPQYAYIAPTYGQARRVAWDLIKEYLKDMPGVTYNEADLRVEIVRPDRRDKIKIMLLGAENPNAIRGIYLDGVILDEYADMNPEVWSMVVRPALSDRLGWAIFIGTPKGQNHFYDMFAQAKGNPEWYAAVFKASETGVIPMSELEAARTVMSEAEYLQEYECSFSAALVGAYYGKEMQTCDDEKRITAVPYDPILPVYTYWDLGMDDTTAIWFLQVVRGRELRWIDYHEESGQGLDHYARILQNKGYLYEEHVLPHDGAVRELGTGKSRQEVLRTLCKGVRVRVAKRMAVADGINAARLMLAKSWFDGSKCEKGIESLKNYERAWDSKNKIYHQTPKHNWASHGADAFRVAGMEVNENRASLDQISKYARHADTDFSVV